MAKYAYRVLESDNYGYWKTLPGQYTSKESAEVVAKSLTITDNKDRYVIELLSKIETRRDPVTVTPYGQT